MTLIFMFICFFKNIFQFFFFLTLTHSKSKYGKLVFVDVKVGYVIYCDPLSTILISALGFHFQRLVPC